MKKRYSLMIFVLITLVFFLIFNGNSKASNLETSNEMIKVDIKGSVNEPGVYELESNSTVSDLIVKSGGLRENADTSLINLSKRLSDQDVIIVYNTDEVLEMRNGSTSVKIVEKECMCPKIDNVGCINDSLVNTNEDDKISKININTASSDELSTLSGIGKSKAEKIIEYRSITSFIKIEDIMNVKGIGQTIFDKIKESITV